MPQSRVLRVTLDAAGAFHLTLELAGYRAGERILVQTSVTQHGIGLADTSSVVAGAAGAAGPRADATGGSRADATGGSRADAAGGPGGTALTVELVAPQRSGVEFDPDAPLLMHTRATTVWSTV